jgi:hypothetical protein
MKQIAFFLLLTGLLGFFAIQSSADLGLSDDAGYWTKTASSGVTGLSQFLAETLNGDYVAAGIGMRNLGRGTITISGIPSGSNIEGAYLYWCILDDSLLSDFKSGIFAGRRITGTLIGTGQGPCWVTDYHYAYRADVTSYVSGNGSYSLRGFASGRTDGADPWDHGSPPPQCEGASLVVIYSNSTLTEKTVIINDGSVFLHYPGDTLNPDTSYTTVMRGFTATAPVTACYTFLGADGQTLGSEKSIFNSSSWKNNWDGSDPQAVGDYRFGNLWDTDTYDVSSAVSGGDTSAIGTVVSLDECLVWIAGVLSVTTGCVDLDPPVITCPQDASFFADKNCKAKYSGPFATATDDCDSTPVITSIPPVPATFNGPGTYTITWFATDSMGKTDTCYQKVTVVDGTPPAITCPASIVLEADANCSATYSGPPASASDYCDPKPRITSIPPVPATFNGVGVNTITWIATDSSGNADTCFQTVTVTDKMPPVITCPPDVSRNADSNCQTTYSGPLATAKDNCDANPKITSIPPLPATFTGPGAHTITWVARDTSGNADTCFQTVTIVDKAKPTITCPRNVTREADADCRVTYSGPSATAIDNCDPNPTVRSNPLLPVTFTGVGLHTITWTATDASGNTTTCFQTVTVTDSTPPVITCPPDTTREADGNCQVTYTGPLATARDNCDAKPKLMSNPPLPATFTGVGTYTITWVAVDSSGNADTCYQTIAAVDRTPPAIACPPNVTREVDVDCEVTYSGPSATATDNCDEGPAVTSDPQIPVTFSGGGVHTISWIATDKYGNADTCYQTITIIDKIPPVITCPTDVIQEVDANCRVTYTGPSATATDNCAESPDITSIPPLPATFTGPGTHTITWIAADPSGNADTCYQTITMVDSTSPALACPSNAILEANAECEATYSGPMATATDNCDVNPKVTSNPPVPAAFSGVGTYTIAWSATDTSGNADTCYQTVVVIDRTKPVLMCPPGIRREVGAECEVTYSGPAATAADNCDANPEVMSDPQLPVTYTGAGNHTITWIAVDESGNADTCLQTITIIDTTPPVISCPPNVTRDADANCRVTYTGPSASATDNCDENLVVTSNPSLPATFTGIGTYIITWTATDASGNPDTCYQTVTVMDTTKPVLACPANVIREADANCQVAYSGPSAGAVDNCDVNPKVASDPPLPATFTGVGVHTITWTAEDASGNVDSSYQTVTLIDKMRPVIDCPASVSREADGNCQVTYSGPSATAVDNCDASVKVTSNPPLPATFTNAGMQTITWTATDSSGNADTCYQTITVTDKTKPIITCPPGVNREADANCQTTYAGPSATATDNCDAKPNIVSLPALPVTFTGIGTRTITWTATDSSGNADTCYQTITVVDKTKPVITCPPDVNREADANCQVTYAGPSATATDNCDANPRVISMPALPVTYTGVGTYTIIWTATDVSGNADTCYQTVEVMDSTAPVITCPEDTTLQADDDCRVTYAGPSATAVDNCDANPKITSVPSLPATLTGVGIHAIRWTATDASGNSATCDQKVIVVDGTPPAITCPKDQVISADQNCQATYSGPPATVIDNCDPDPEITSIPPLPATFTGVGAYTIIWTAVDSSGNESTCSQRLEVIDDTGPAITCPSDTAMQADENCQATYSGPPATVIDNCDPDPEITSIPPLPATFTGAGTYTITWTAVDSSGNESTCSQRVKVIDVTEPLITCPRDMIIKLDKKPNIKCEVTYSGPPATATDNCDASPKITSVPPLPATFKGAGTHTITWTATDESGNKSSCDQKITVIDLIPPAITCPSDTAIEVDANCQATYSGPAATAIDNCDPNPKVTSVPPLPATFTGVGTYAITWTATDTSGNKFSCDQNITVIDVTPPAITCPEDVVLPGDENCQAVYSGPSATAVDNCDSKPVITSDPALPATLRGAGSHAIVYTATDASGNSSTCTQTVTITDVIAPVITCPPDTSMAAESLDCSATYSGPAATAFDNCDGNPVVTSVPSLPAKFNTIGEHDIVFTATDLSGNSSICKMTVTVSMTSYCTKNEVIPRLQALLPTGEKKVDEKIEKAIESLWHSLNVDPKHPGKPWKKEPLWLNSTHLDPKHGEPVFEEEEEVAKYLDQAMKEKKCPPEIKDDLLAAIFSVVSCDQMLARVQIDDAKKAGGDPKEIEKAEKEMVEAKEKWDKGDYEQAVEHYENAWLHAIKAMGKNLLAGGQSAVEVASPCAFALSQNNPNPFARETTISFSLPERADTRLTVCDITGRVVAVLADREMERGIYSLVWNRECCASGIYFYSLQSGDRSLTKKMTVIR